MTKVWHIVLCTVLPHSVPFAGLHNLSPLPQICVMSERPEPEFQPCLIIAEKFPQPHASDTIETVSLYRELDTVRYRTTLRP